MEIRTTIVGSAEVVERLRSAPARLRERLRAVVATSGAELQADVKSGRLTGQVLNVQTGRLRRSINLRVTQSAEAITASVGTNVSYGRFWELGFQGVENVRAHVRSLGKVRGGKDARQQGVAFVRAHSRIVNQGPRPFLQPALAEARPRFMARVRRTAAEGL